MRRIDYKECLAIVFGVSSVIFFSVFLISSIIISFVPFELSEDQTNIITISCSLFVMSLSGLIIIKMIKRCENEIEIQSEIII